MMRAMAHLTSDQLEAGLDQVRSSPTDAGSLDLIVARPDVEIREILGSATLDLEVGLVGDNWLERGSRNTDDGSAEPGKQLNVINARLAALVAGPGADAARRALAGDQLHLDLDLSDGNLPAGTRLAIGDAVIEITPDPHRGCAKFTQRFGLDAMRFVNSDVGRELRLRGLCARVVQSGTIRAGDEVTVTRP
jgi:hypothetical protein